MKYVTMKAYDDTLVRVEKSKINEFKRIQERINELLKQGKSINEIDKLINEGSL